MATMTFTGAAGEGVIFQASAGTFAGNRASASGDTALDFALQVQTETTAFLIARTFWPFDTSALPDGATITSAKLTLYRDDTVDTFGNTNNTTIEIVPSTQNSPTAIVVGDYSRITFSSKGSIAFSATTNLTLFDITITDLTIINKTGFTLLAGITGRDLNNSAPTGSNTLAYQSNADAHPPTLSVTYTSTNIKTVDGLAVASVKTIDAVPIASVKTWNGIA